MVISRAYAFNSGNTISGTRNVGGISAQIENVNFQDGNEWVNGPDESLGYIICAKKPNVVIKNIIKNGLILHLDAGNSGSYPGYGNIWYDISGNEHHAYGDPSAAGSGYSDSRFPIHQNTDNGRFYFDGSKGLTILTDLGSHTELTADFWLYKIGGTIDYIFDARNNGGSWWLSDYLSHNINIHGALEADDPVTYTSSSNWWGKWINIVIKSNSSGSELWIDGENINDSRLKSSSSLNEALGQYFRIGNRYTSSGRWYGYFASIRYYNRVLSDSELLHNYNSEKGRFGL